MKQLFALGMFVLAIFLISGCANRGNPYPSEDLTSETWTNNVNTNPNSWTRGSDHWFLTGNPNITEQDSMSAPLNAAISTTMVRVADFSNIQVDGPFQVQIFGSYDGNSVYVYGPNAAARQVAIDVNGDTLSIRYTGDGKNIRDVEKVIIRVGVVNLHRLIQLGGGRIEGRQIRSTGLEIVSRGRGNMYLAGGMNLSSINHTGAGFVNVFGASSRALNITSCGTGNVNVSGSLAVRTIIHRGRNDINIIGANGGATKVYAENKGKVGILGNVDIREITAKDETCVFAYCINSPNLYVYASYKAKVGLTGVVTELYENAKGKASIKGRYLIAQSAYVRAYDNAHINVTATNKLYASAMGNSTIYFFGTPNAISQFLNGNGTIIPIWYDAPGGSPVCQIKPLPCYKEEAPCRAPVHRVERHVRPVHHKVHRVQAPKQPCDDDPIGMTGWQKRHHQ